MARTLDRTTTNTLTWPSGTLTTWSNAAAAISVGMWTYVRSVVAGTDSDVLIRARFGNNLTFLVMQLSHTSSASVVFLGGGRSQSADSLQSTTITTGSVPLNTLTHYGMVLDFANDAIRLYINGAQVANTSVTFGASTIGFNTSGLTSLDSLGATLGNTGTTATSGAQFDGDMGEVGLWAGDITTAGFQALAAGYSPAIIRPNFARVYAPIYGNDASEPCMGVAALTVNGTLAKADHPRVYMPNGRTFFAKAAGPAILASGTASGSATGSTTASLSVGTASGGTAPYTYQWYRDTTPGFTPSGANDIVGATSTTLNDTGLIASTTYYYKCVVTDNVAATATSNEVTIATTSGAAASRNRVIVVL